MTPAESKEERRRKQKELDCILDAALDELDESDNDDSEGDIDNDDDEDEDDVNGSSGNIAAETSRNDGTVANVEKTDSKCRLSPSASSASSPEPETKAKRPQFGPERPPPRRPGPGSVGPLSAEDAQMAASIEGMMQQFLRAGNRASPDQKGGDSSDGGGGLGEMDERHLANGLADLENAEKALEEMFQQMMTAAPPPATAKAKPRPKRSSPSASKHPSAASSAKEKDRPKSKQGSEDVGEAVSKLLDGMARASASDPAFDPTSPQLDAARLEQFGDDMMNNVMREFEKMNHAQDSDEVMDGVMKQLLDKDLMYEPMKQVMTKFPAWLAENKDRLPEEEYTKYGKQYQYFQKIVRVYETEPDNFSRLMELMQDIQEFGQPPVEIIKELAPELKFDEEGMPVMDAEGMPGMPFPGNEQCCLM